MSCTVFADGMGLFHKGSGGTGVAPGDVCLSPPPPPSPPAPVPYVNNLAASDLTKGSTSVTIQNSPTALENSSEISTSTGDEAGTQGGGLVTHKTKGKGTFTLWSFTVKIQGKGVCCHGHPMMQNESSVPGNIVCASAQVITNLTAYGYIEKYKCSECEEEAFKRHAPTTAQQQAVDAQAQAESGCWSCPKLTNSGTFGSGREYNRAKWTPDHQPPQNYAWLHLGGCKGACDEPPDGDGTECKAKFKKWAQDPQTCIPQCASCSCSQGGYVGSHDGVDAMKELMAAL